MKTVNLELSHSVIVKQGTKQAKQKFRFLVVYQINNRDKEKDSYLVIFQKKFHRHAVKIRTVYLDDTV